METAKRITFFTRFADNIPVSRFRSYALKKELEETGFECRLYPLYSPAVARRWYGKGREANTVSRFFAALKRLLQLLFISSNEIVVIEYPLLPGAAFSVQKWLLRKQKHVVTDLLYASPDEINDDDLQGLLSLSKIIVTPGPGITRKMLSFPADVIEIPPCVSAKEYSDISPAAIPDEEANTFRIGWLGTGATSTHLLMITDCLRQLNDLYHIRLVLIGFDKRKEKELQGLPYTIHPRDTGTEISALQTCDAGILPLPDASVPAVASSFPMIQYMACGLPVVASSNEVTIAINRGSDNLFARTPFEWYSCLAAMIQNKAFYKEEGEKNRLTVKEFYSGKRLKKDYLTALQNIVR